MERISGPFMGHYVAAYAVPTGNRFVGYAKICTDEPQDVWQCDAIDKVATRPRDTGSMALADAEAKARVFLDMMHDYYDFAMP